MNTPPSNAGGSPGPEGVSILFFESSGGQPVANSAWTERFGTVPPTWQNLFLEEDRPLANGLVAQPGSSAELRLAPARAPRASDDPTGTTPVRVALQAVSTDRGPALWGISIPPGPSDAMNESLERERALGEMRMRFLSLVSHEFRTPLTVILSSAELLEHYGEAWPETKRKSHFLRLQNAVTTMTTLLDNVSFLGRAESGKLENAPDRLSLRRMVDSICDDLSALRGPDQPVEIRVDPPDASVTFDPRILRAVLANLLSNALRFSPPSSPVAISVNVRPGTLEFEIDDRGAGIPAGESERVWEPFERGSNAIGIPGSGLGLAIVRRCMELVGGNAAHLPNPIGQGTRAVARIPLGDQPR
jgi:signal transduction histidine kinase